MSTDELELDTLGDRKTALFVIISDAVYSIWARDSGFRQMNSKNFVGELRKRYDVRRDGGAGNVVLDLSVDFPKKPCASPNERGL